MSGFAPDPAPADLADLVGRLAAADLDGWQGLPPGLSPGGEPPAALELGDEHVPAAMVHGEGSARVWSRGGQVVLVDVALRPSGPAEALEALGSYESEPVSYGLDRAEERVYGERGLAAVVEPAGAALRHLLAFVPTSAADYRRTLRPGLGATRRPRGER